MIAQAQALPVAAAPSQEADPRLARMAELSGELAALLGDLARRPLASPQARPAEEPARLLTVGDLALRLQVGARTIRRWRERGLLPPAVEVAGVVRWRPAAIEAWIAAREEPS